MTRKEQASRALDAAYDALTACAVADWKRCLDAWSAAAEECRAAVEEEDGGSEWLRAVSMIEAAEQRGLRAPAWCYSVVA